MDHFPKDWDKNKTSEWNHHLWPKLLILGMVIPPLIGNSLSWVYKPLLFYFGLKPANIPTTSPCVCLRPGDANHLALGQFHPWPWKNPSALHRNEIYRTMRNPWFFALWKLIWHRTVTSFNGEIQIHLINGCLIIVIFVFGGVSPQKG